MANEMKRRYRLFRRNKANYFAFDNHSGNSKSLHTRDRHHAERLIHALNEAESEPLVRRQVGLIYLSAADPEAAKRTWQSVMDAAVEFSSEKSKARWKTAIKDKAFDSLRRRLLVDSRSEDFLRTLTSGTVSTNVHLRRLQNLALDLGWIFEPILKKRLFPKPSFKKKRAITLDEHRRIIEREKNLERLDYYEVLWFTGGGQSDIAQLEAGQINWTQRVLTYRRLKNGQPAQIQISETLATVLKRRPATGPLFPYLTTVREIDRANEFRQRCKGLKISGVTLHSYRYSWAQRAKAAGYPQRYAQQALGHSSKAVTEAYAADAQFVLPSLEEFELRNNQAKVIVVDFPKEAPSDPALQAPQSQIASQEHNVNTRQGRMPSGGSPGYS